MITLLHEISKEKAHRLKLLDKLTCYIYFHITQDYNKTNSILPNYWDFSQLKVDKIIMII